MSAISASTTPVITRVVSSSPNCRRGDDGGGRVGRFGRAVRGGTRRRRAACRATAPAAAGCALGGDLGGEDLVVVDVGYVDQRAERAGIVVHRFLVEVAEVGLRPVGRLAAEAGRAARREQLLVDRVVRRDLGHLTRGRLRPVRERDGSARLADGRHGRARRRRGRDGGRRRRTRRRRVELGRPVGREGEAGRGAGVGRRLAARARLLLGRSPP